MTTFDTIDTLVPSFAQARRPQPSACPRSLHRTHLVAADEPTVAERIAFARTAEYVHTRIDIELSGGYDTEWSLPALPPLPYLVTQPESGYRYNGFPAHCWTPDCL